MDFWSAAILGIVQGITEFLPVSSSGHLVLVREFLHVDKAYGLAFDAVLHLSTTLAIIVYFWTDIWVLTQTAIRKLGRLPVNPKDLTLLYALLLGTVPAAVAGIFFESLIDNLFNDAALIVATILFIAAIFFMYTEWKYYTRPPQGILTVKTGLKVGFFQVLALLPGFSRSGATLAGGMLLGMSRIESARFSFLLAIPITLGVGTKKLLELIITNGQVNWLYIGVGSVISFIIALVMLHFFLAFIRRYTLWPFIWYTIILSVLIIYMAIYV